MSSQNLELEDIVKTYKNNYSSILHEFISVQSDFLSDIYKRYDKDLDAANIVLYFARNLHGKTLRERDKDLEFNISFENFWKNLDRTEQDNSKIIEIAESTGLPKETARRKVNHLIKNKVLQKNKNYIYWSPPPDGRNSYNTVVDRQINQISKLVQTISFYLNFKIPKEKITSELKKNFSFFWFHYLSTQLKYLKMWQKELNDLELILIGLQCVIQTNLDFKKRNINFEDHFFTTKQNLEKLKLSDNFSVSATSVSEVTGVPRATCIRKLEKLNKMKIVKKNFNSKRFQIDLKNFQTNALNSKKISQNTIEMFSEFFLIVLKALRRKDKD